jgi:type IV pilus assembly protein PilB
VADDEPKDIEMTAGFETTDEFESRGPHDPGIAGSALADPSWYAADVPGTAAPDPALTGGPDAHDILSSPPIGELMVRRGLISREQLDLALELQRENGRKTGETLVGMGAISTFDLARSLAERLGREFVDLNEVALDFMVANSIPEEMARRYNALPIAVRNGHLFVAMGDPEDVFALDDLRMMTGYNIVAAFGDPQQIAAAINRMWSRATVDAELDSVAEATQPEKDPLASVTEEDQGPIIRLVNAIIDQALDERASDIHLEPGTDILRIRYRVDGILRDVSYTPLRAARALVSRVKVMSNIDIANTRTPQDGRFTITSRNRVVDVRAVTLPTASGEAVVMRILDRTQSIASFDRLGFGPGEIDRFVEETKRPQGAILVTGPTGSGKTSTLYAAAASLDINQRSMVTVEDPVEYRLDHVKQVQIDVKAGRTFPATLRAVLRADPDMIFVGEIRDHETARIAAEAAVTGHLVLSTIHTTSAAATPIRLVDMGVEPYLVASAVTCIAAQRLLRRLCKECAQPDPRAAKWLRSLHISEDEHAPETVMAAVGCPVCHGAGFSGRVAVIEVLKVTEDIERLIVRRAPTREVEQWAIAEGMDTLRTVAIRRVLDGVTSIDEVLRVVR